MLKCLLTGGFEVSASAKLPTHLPHYYGDEGRKVSYSIHLTLMKLLIGIKFRNPTILYKKNGNVFRNRQEDPDHVFFLKDKSFK